MPALGESVTEGTVTRWLKQVGDTVAVDEPLLEVSTDKVDTEIPSPVAGTLQEILVGEDATVPVGADLAVIGDGAAPSADATEEQPAEQREQPAEPPSAEQPSEASAEQPSEAPAEQPAAAAQPEESQEDVPEPSAAEQQGSEPAARQPAHRGPSDGSGTTVTMPALGESVTEGTVTRWLKAEGDTVEVDEPLLEVSTDKVDTEVPSPAAGTVQRLLVGEDETVPVGAELAVIGTGSGAAAAPAAEQPPEQQPAAEEKAAEQPAPERPAEPADQQPQGQEKSQDETPREAAQETRQEERQEAPAQTSATPSSAPSTAQPGVAREVGDAASYVTPLVRKLAGEHHVDLAEVTGTGVGGRIRKQDVLDVAKAREAAAPAAPEPAAASTAPAPTARAQTSPEVAAKRGTTEKMTRLRKVIAQRMVESLQVSAQLTTVVEVDVTKISRLRNRAKNDFQAREGVKLSFLPFFALAVVEALKIHPMVNASIEGDEITYHGQENLGIAVDTERGLLVPVIKDAGDLNIAGLARRIADLAERTRTNKIVPDELGGGTFTLTNTGSRGALFDTPIINQPQVGILGTGSVVRKPVVVNDPEGGETIAIRSMVYLALSYDHRLVDGADAARFLTTVKERLEEGAFDSDLGL
ncbi:MAG: 2-oxoglutarate dehydrogenase, E2 component, dihydrolipoamide succinyltransferase [Actinomycetales bacterium]